MTSLRVFLEFIFVKSFAIDREVISRTTLLMLNNQRINGTSRSRDGSTKRVVFVLSFTVFSSRVSAPPCKQTDEWSHTVQDG
jgi:hypothetical protein